MTPEEMDTRQRLVSAARRLFLKKGYRSTSVSEILRGAEANSGSLYHFFPTKQDLLLAVLDGYRDGIRPMLFDPAWKGVEDPIKRIFALLACYRTLLEESDFFYGCPIGSLALELHEPDPPVRELLAANFDAWRAGVEECLDAAGERLPPDLDREALAALILTVMEGGVMQARTYRNPAPFDAGVDLLRDYLDRLQDDVVPPS